MRYSEMVIVAVFMGQESMYSPSKANRFVMPKEVFFVHDQIANFIFINMGYLIFKKKAVMYVKLVTITALTTMLVLNVDNN